MPKASRQQQPHCAVAPTASDWCANIFNCARYRSARWFPRTQGLTLLCATTACSLAISCSQPATRTEAIAFPFAPPSGTAWRVTEQRVTTTIRAGRKTVQPIDSAGTLAVVATGSTGATMEWTLETSTLNGAPTSQGMTEGLIGSPIRFRTDQSGAPTIVESITVARSSDAPGRASDSANPLDRLLKGTDPGTLALMLLPQVTAISSCQNLQFGAEHTFTRQGEAPGIGAGSPIRYSVVVVLDDPGSASRPALLRITESFDPESAAASFSQAYQAAGRLPKNGLPLMARDTVTNCEIDTTTGVTTRVRVETTVRTEDVELRETREITLGRTR